MEHIYDQIKEGTRITLKPEQELMQALRHRNFYSNENNRSKVSKQWGSKEVTVKGTPEENLRYFYTLEAGTFPYNAIKYATNIY